jgi:urease subunit gamma/beta
VRLLPREQNRLQVFAAAELARRRRARGLLLSQGEAVALISDEVMEAARDGLEYAAVEQRGYEILVPADVLEDVPLLVGRIELEALFADGHRLIVLHDPITSGGPPSLDAADAVPQWLEGGTPLQLANTSDVPIALTSHFHVFEANRRLLLDRRAAWGMRLAVAAGVKVVIEPGQTREVRVVPFGGARIVRGHAGLVDGPLDAPGALEAALALARERGYAGA